MSRQRHTALDAAHLEGQIREANDVLSRRPEVTDEVRNTIEQVVDAILAAPEADLVEFDPYLVAALQRGALGALRALTIEEPGARRTTLRVSLEQARQALRDIAEEAPVAPETEPKELVRWLSSVVDAPQRTMSDLLHTSPRTYQRWVSSSDPAAPRGQEVNRVRMVAAIVNQLRHAMTGRGAIDWFSRPHPELKGEPPATLLKKLDSLPLLHRLAAATRSSGAT